MIHAKIVSQSFAFQVQYRCTESNKDIDICFLNEHVDYREKSVTGSINNS